jgi:hypothetical protein
LIKLLALLLTLGIQGLRGDESKLKENHFTGYLDAEVSRMSKDGTWKGRFHLL